MWNKESGQKNVLFILLFYCFKGERKAKFQEWFPFTKNKQLWITFLIPGTVREGVCFHLSCYRVESGKGLSCVIKAVRIVPAKSYGSSEKKEISFSLNIDSKNSNIVTTT